MTCSYVVDPDTGRACGRPGAVEATRTGDTPMEWCKVHGSIIRIATAAGNGWEITQLDQRTDKKAVAVPVR